jgi:hypothetical protein
MIFTTLSAVAALRSAEPRFGARAEVVLVL